MKAFLGLTCTYKVSVLPDNSCCFIRENDLMSGIIDLWAGKGYPSQLASFQMQTLLFHNALALYWSIFLSLSLILKDITVKRKYVMSSCSTGVMQARLCEFGKCQKTSQNLSSPELNVTFGFSEMFLFIYFFSPGKLEKWCQRKASFNAL